MCCSSSSRCWDRDASTPPTCCLHLLRTMSVSQTLTQTVSQSDNPCCAPHLPVVSPAVRCPLSKPLPLLQLLHMLGAWRRLAVGLLSFILQGEEEDVRLGMEQNPPGSTAGGLGAEEGINQSVNHSQSVNQSTRNRSRLITVRNNRAASQHIDIHPVWSFELPGGASRERRSFQKEGGASRALGR